MATSIEPAPWTSGLTGVGAAAVLLGYFVVPWGDGDSFIQLRSDVFADQWPDADLNRKLQEAFGIWGFVALIALAVGSTIAIRRTDNQRLLTALAVLLLGGVAWHQAMIGTVFGLNMFQYLPQLGAVLCAAGLWAQKVQLKISARKAAALAAQPTP